MAQYGFTLADGIITVVGALQGAGTFTLYWKQYDMDMVQIGDHCILYVSRRSLCADYRQRQIYPRSTEFLTISGCLHFQLGIMYRA